jgi:hypothetical protein
VILFARDTGSTANPAARVFSARVLFTPGEPSTVARLISLLGIDSINRVLARWPLAHVFKEVQEVAPSFTYFDSSRSIKRIRGVASVFAAFVHGFPGLPRDGVRQTMLVGRRPLAGIRREFRARLVGVSLPPHGMIHSGIVPGDILRNALAAKIDGGHFATSACARLGNQFSHKRILGFGWIPGQGGQ